MTIGNYILLSLGLISLASCDRKIQQIAGCTDIEASNYNSNANVATACNYYASDFAGKYLVADTCITYHSDTLHYWYDTIVSAFVITAVAERNYLEFDTLLCIHCNAGNVAQYADSLIFSSFYYHYPMNKSQDGSIVKDTLRYQVTLDPLTFGYIRKGRGIKIH